MARRMDITLERDSAMTDLRRSACAFKRRLPWACAYLRPTSSAPRQHARSLNKHLGPSIDRAQVTRLRLEYFLLPRESPDNCLLRPR